MTATKCALVGCTETATVSALARRTRFSPACTGAWRTRLCGHHASAGGQFRDVRILKRV